MSHAVLAWCQDAGVEWHCIAPGNGSCVRWGLDGVIWGKPVRTTISDKSTPYLLDRVNRLFCVQRRTGYVIKIATLSFLQITTQERKRIGKDTH